MNSEKRIDYFIRSEPKGDDLAALLRHGVRACDQFLFALTGMVLDDSATSLMADLRLHLRGCEERTEYPAGRLPWGTMNVCTYDFNPDSLSILLEATDHLYGWVEPALPNDLCLMRGDEPWLITMASDRVALLALSSSERDEVHAAIPGLTLVRRT
jgi:hypothetical protein